MLQVETPMHWNLRQQLRQAAGGRAGEIRPPVVSLSDLTDVIVDESTVWRGARFNQRTRWFDGQRRRPPL